MKKILFYVVRLTMCGFCGINEIYKQVHGYSLCIWYFFMKYIDEEEKIFIKYWILFYAIFLRILKVHTQKIQIYRAGKKMFLILWNVWSRMSWLMGSLAEISIELEFWALCWLFILDVKFLPILFSSIHRRSQKLSQGGEFQKTFVWKYSGRCDFTKNPSKLIP